ncbi:MAG: hypothetical protein M0T69_01945 [Deltaproteobacteria bacterium]|nr:hypothetical protein [Deltaproteobacteria bacterium]
MDFSADYVRARKTVDDLMPPSDEAIAALAKPSFDIPPPGPANFGQPPNTAETSTITGKPKEKGLPAPSGEAVPSHENPEESAWDTMVRGVQSLKGISKQAAGGTMRAVGEQTFYGMEGVSPEEPAPGNVPALIEPGKALAAEGKKDVERTLPNVPAGSFKAHLYGSIQSVGLNVGAIGLGMATGGETLPLLLMGALSGGQDYAENRAAGVSRDDAWVGALANGAAEYFGEKLPLHAYLKEGAPLFRRMITGALLELPGELGTQVVQSAEEKLTRNPGMTWEDFLGTMKDTAIQTLMATTITGGVVGAAGTLAGGARNLGEKGSVGSEKPAPPAFDDETFAAEGKRLGVEYKGIQAFGNKKGAIFQDEKTGSFAVQPGETVENGLNRVRARFGLSPLLTPEKILSAFPGAAVAAGEGDFTVALPNGANIRILPDQSIELDPSTGVTLEPGENLAGEYTKKIGPEAIIRLAKEGAGDDTLLHESFHAAMDFALTPQEKAVVLAEHGGDVEAAAQAYAEWNPRFRNPMFQKVVDFFRKIREMLLGPTAEGTFGRLRSGEAWQRSDQDPEAFFSRLADRVRSEMPDQAHPEDVAAFMREEGVRPDEVVLSGVVAKDGAVAKADVLSAIEETRKETTGLPDYQIRRQADSPPFVSQLRNVVADEKMFPPSMKAPSVVNTLMRYGVKAAEIQDTGLAKFLADKPRVTREELLDYIDMNMVRVEEVVRTDDATDQVEPLDFSEPQPDEETGEYDEEPEWFAQGMALTYRITRGIGNRALGPFRLEIFDAGNFDAPVDTARGRSVDELIDYANKNEREAARTVGNVKYEDYVLPGAGKNYRELLITLPRPKLANFLPDRAAYDAAIQKAGPHFDSPHWDEPNVLAHIRFDERVDAAGKPTLFIEEVQSDWAAALRKWDASTAEDPTGAPPMPFKDTWYELAMKRAIRWAAEHGHDSISWTTGDQQAERYDLAKRIESLAYTLHDDGTYSIQYVPKGSRNPNEDFVTVPGRVTDKNMGEIVGKEMAEKIISGQGSDSHVEGWKEFSGLDLKVGGEWARKLYDRTLPGWLNKYAKKWGVKVGETEIKSATSTKYAVYNISTGEQIKVFDFEEAAQDWVLSSGKSYEYDVMDRLGNPLRTTVHSLQIPPAMAADVLKKGQPLYQKKSGRFPGTPNDKGYTFNSNDSEQVKNAGRALLLNVWGDVEFTQSHEETSARAQEMLDQGIVNIERLMARKQDEAFATPELMVAADRLRFGMIARLVDTAQQWKKGDGSVTDEEMRNAIALSSGLTQILQGGISQGARVLNARQIAFEGQQPGSKEWTDAVSGTLESIRQLQGAEGMPLESIVTKIMEVPEPSTFLPKLQKITSRDMFIEAWYGALLSNPVTHMANFIGNTVALFSSIPERGLASLAHRITGKGEGVAPGETFAALYGLVNGFQDALRFAAKAAKTGESSFNGEKMERRSRQPAITGANLGASGPIGAAVDLLGMAIRGPGRALLSSDEFFKAVNFRMEVYAQAYREAYSEGLTGDDLKNRMAELVQNPPDIISETAAEWASYQTFTNALGPIGSAIVAFSNSHPAMKVILPFVATPTNILKFTFERLGPLSLALKSVREDIAAGGSRRDLAIARTSLGSMVMATAAALAAAGFITGGGPKDKDLLAAKKRKGWQPYSFKIGDRYYSFARMEPYATLFGMTADIVEMVGERSDLEIDAMAKAMVLSFAKNMTSKTYLTGVSDALEAITDPDKGGGRFIHRFVGSWVPAGVAQLERVVDPTLRDTYGPTSRGEPNALIREAKSMLREMRARTPGLSSTLPPRLNLWGDPILLGGGLGPDIISPVYKSIEKESPADDEILRNRVSISMPSRFLYGSRPSDDIQMRDASTRTGIPLTPKEYDFLVRVAAGQKVVVDGTEYQVTDQTLKAALEEMIKTPEYKAATDGPDGGKALMIRARVTAYRDAAKAMLLDASPELTGLYEEKIQERAEALVGVN